MGSSPARAAKVPVFWSALLGIFAADFITKALAVSNLVRYVPHEVLGDYVRWSLAYNPGAAFSVSVGPASRVVFSLLAVIAVAILARMYRETAPGDRLRALSLGLVCGGAIGNLADRLRLDREGVVDFIDIGLSPAQRWYTFNIADMAVTSGAVLLAWLLWREDRATAAAVAPAAVEGRVAEGQEG